MSAYWQLHREFFNCLNEKLDGYIQIKVNRSKLVNFACLFHAKVTAVSSAPINAPWLLNKLDAFY
jgi:hypothetical protein